MTSLLCALIPSIQVCARNAVFAATGIAVSDLAASKQIYSEGLGMQQSGSVISTPQFDEIVMRIPGEDTGAAVVLMKWKSPKQTTNLPVKMVFYD